MSFSYHTAEPDLVCTYIEYRGKPEAPISESMNKFFFEILDGNLLIIIMSTIGIIRIKDGFDDVGEAREFFCNKETRQDYDNEAYDFEGNPFHILSYVLHSQQQGGCTVSVNGCDVVPDRIEDTAGWPDVVDENTAIRLDGKIVPLRTIF